MLSRLLLWQEHRLHACILSWQLAFQLEVHAVVIGPQLVAQKIEKCFSPFLAIGTLAISAKKLSSHGCRNGCVLENALVVGILCTGHDGALRHVGRYQNRRNSDAKSVKGKRDTGPGSCRGCDKTVGRTGR